MAAPMKELERLYAYGRYLKTSHDVAIVIERDWEDGAPVSWVVRCGPSSVRGRTLEIAVRACMAELEGTLSKRRDEAAKLAAQLGKMLDPNEHPDS